MKEIIAKHNAIEHCSNSKLQGPSLIRARRLLLESRAALNLSHRVQSWPHCPLKSNYAHYNVTSNGPLVKRTRNLKTFLVVCLLQMYSKKNKPDDKMMSHRQLCLTKIVGATRCLSNGGRNLGTFRQPLERFIFIRVAEDTFFLTFGV